MLISGKAGAANEALQDPAVAGLAQFGYPVSACMEALERLKGDPDAAHQDLFNRLAGRVFTGLLKLYAPVLQELCTVPWFSATQQQVISQQHVF